MVAIIIVHYGRIETTLNCLSSLKTALIAPTNPIIIINNSRINIKNTIRKKFRSVIIIDNPKNLGYAAALNIGIKLQASRHQYFLILNNDVTVKKKFLHDLLHFVKKHRADLVSPKILDQNGNIWFDGGEIDKNRYTAGHKKGKFDTFDGAKRRSVSTLSDPAKGEGVERVDFLSGCCLLIKKEVFEKIGFFNEQYFMYYEDVDFCLRAKKLGFKLGIAKKVIACHDIKRTKKGTKLMEYYLARNHLLFVKKHAPLFVKIRELIRLPKTLWQHYRKKEFEAIKGIKDFFQKDLFR